jgi:hypothetical protein
MKNILKMINRICKKSPTSALFALIFMFMSLNAWAQNGKIEGRVFDKTSNEPLPFANIIVEGTNIGTTSDLDGNFMLTGLSPGYVKLRASFVGYSQALSPDVQVTNAKIAYVEIAMEALDTKLEEVTVQASPFKRTEESPVSLQRIGIAEIENNPGSNRDISKVIQSFPGVGSTVSFRNDIIIRGGGPNESRFYLDDMEIPNLNHFATQGASGGPVGILNADFISSVNYYSGAFPANRGNALSGVFEFTQADGNKEKPKFRATVGASEMGLTSDGPIGEKTSYIVSARQSYLQFLFDAIGLPFLPTFNDYQLKFRTRFNTKNELKIISIGALDRFKLNTGIENPDEEQAYILNQLPVNEQWNYAIGAVYKHYSENEFQTVVLSRNMLDNMAYKHPGNDENLPRILDYSSREIENKFRYETNGRNGLFKYAYSIGGEYAKYINDTYRQAFIENNVAEINYYSFLEVFKWNFSGQLSKNFFQERLSVSMGIRGDANNYSKSMQNILNQLSPRASLSYMLTPDISVNANTGIYKQLPAYTTLGYRDNTGQLVNKANNLRYITVEHYIAGVEYRYRPRVNFTLEGFFKDYSKYPFSVRDSVSLANKGGDFGVVGDEEVVSIGKGRAYGFELTNRTKLPKFNLIMAYTFVRSEFVDKNGAWLPSSWDSKHLFTATAVKTFNKNWSAGFKWRFVGALPYTPYDMELSSIKSAYDINGGPYLDYDRINANRLNNFHQLDIRADKKFFFDKWSLMLYVDIQNAYNFVSESQDYIIRDKDDEGNFILLDDGNRYQLKRIATTSGTLLPTIGLMVEF